MDKLLKFIFDIVIAIVLMFGAVLIYFGLRTESVIGTMDTMITEEFLTGIKKNGCLEHDQYEEYLHRLSLTDTIYDLRFEHEYSIWEPEYRMRTIEEIIEAQKAAYTGENIYHYREVTTSRPDVTDPIDNSGLTMNTETNESVLAGAVNTPSTGHTHTDSCYAGHIHKGDRAFTHTHAHTAAAGCKRYMWCAGADVTCHSCGASYYWTIVTRDPDGRNLDTPTMPVNWCISCGAGTVTNTLGVNKYAYSCGYNIHTTDDMNSDEVAFGVTMTYPGMSYPQNTNSATYTSGCYTYHQSNDWRSLKRYSGYGVWINEAEVFDAVLRRSSSFCDIPARYEKEYWASDREGLGETKRYEIDYAARVLGRYSVVYDFKYYGWYSSQSHPKNDWPNGISGAETAYLFSSFHSSIERYAGGTAFKGDVSDSWRYRYTGTDLHICGFDHSMGVNRWVPTCGLEEDTRLVCPDKVVSITPTHPLQSVYTNEPLITTVRATYADGSEKTVLAAADFSTGTPVSNKRVTLSYADSLGNTKTCTITVNVVPRNRACANGHLYNLSPDGSDPGCPFCHAYVANLRILHPPISTFTITIGTTLKENGLKLLVTYMNGRTETITEGYVDNLDKQYLGTKMVTIGYKGASTQLLVTTVCAKMVCDVCGFLYDLYPDGTNPGCPRCISKIPIFTGNILEYEGKEYTDEILERMYEKGSYDLTMDNTFSIWLKNKSPNVARSLLKKLYPSLSKEWMSRRFNENIKAK
ncbi:hypothetical protein HNQ56_000952 [Anaerotaenia torta]|uniref:hypothetical protein n=1 Tax=Anaerotaenia torta TaxID=433293 RepID=UPI003D1A7A74